MNKFTFAACLVLGTGNTLWAQYGTAARRAVDQTTANRIDAAPVDLKQNLAATVNVINQRLTDVTQLSLGKRTPQAILKPFEEMRTYLRQMDALSSALVQNHSDAGLVSLGEHYKEWAQALETRIFNDPLYERLQKSAGEDSALTLSDHAQLTNYFNEIRRQALASPVPHAAAINPKLPEKLLAQARQLFGDVNAGKLAVLSQDIVNFVAQPHDDSEKILGSAVNIGMFKKALPLLPPRELQIFTLRYIQGLDPNEISGQLGISPNTSNGTLTSARKRLKGLLSVDHLPVHSAGESDQETSEKDTIAAAQNGNEANREDAMGLLYEKHYKRVYNIIFRIVHSPDDAEELAQDVFLKLFKKIKQFRGESAFSTWLYRVAANAALMKLRKKTVPIAHSLDEPVADAAEGIGANAPSWGDRIKDTREQGPETNLIRREEEEALQKNINKALNKLPPGQRKILLWYDRDDLTHRQIANKLGFTEGSSKSQLARARQKMRELLHPDSDVRDSDTIEVVPSEVSEPTLAAKVSISAD